MNALTYPTPENTMFDVALHGPRMGDGAPSNAAFFSSSGINALRRFNRVLCRVAPSAAAVFARRLIGTPPRHAPRQWELDLLARAVVNDHRRPPIHSHRCVGAGCHGGAGALLGRTRHPDGPLCRAIGQGGFSGDEL